MNDPAHCPRCGASLASDAPEGLCPRCLAALPLGPETEVPGVTEGMGSPPPLSIEEIAPHLPQLEILECLGRGGMGVVYKARQKALNRLVALKLLAPEREKDTHFAERFAREAQALAALSHSNIVTIHDFGQTNGFYYLVMEYVDGVNLRELLRARKLTPEEALAIVPPLCEALQYAHERGIVHRDIKPENLLLDKAGKVKIADFGIAKILGAEMADEQAAGTPAYMAPEQKETPQRVDSRADIYSLGVVFYELLTGELPSKNLQPPSSRVRGVQIDVRLDEIVLRALEKSPELRFQTATEMRTRVEAVVNEPAGEQGRGVRKGSEAKASAPVAGMSKAAGPPPPLGAVATSPARQARSPWTRRVLWLVVALLCLPLLLVLLGSLWKTWRPGRIHRSRVVAESASSQSRQKDTSPFYGYARARQAVITFNYGQVSLANKSLAFRYKVPVDPHWDVWLRATTWQQSQRVGEPERISGDNTRVLSARDGKFQIDVDAAPIPEQLARLDAINRASKGVTMQLRPGQPETLLDLKLAGNERISLAVELRPKPVATKQPTFQIYLRQLTADRDGGSARASYEIVETPGGFDLVLETAGADVRELARDGTVLTPIPYESGADSSTTADSAAAGIGRTLLTGRGEMLDWKFSPFSPNDRPTRVFIGDPVRGYLLTPTTPLTLFSFKDIGTGQTISATIKMVWKPLDPRPVSAPAKPIPAKADAAVSRARPAPAQTAPQVEITVDRTEVPAGTRSIMLYFERDRKPGLILEVAQDVIAAPDGRLPGPGYRTWRDRTFFAADTTERAMGWTLPTEFTEPEAAAAALGMQQRWKGTRALAEEERIEFATLTHSEGWKYVLLARVIREAGWPHPVPPAGAEFTRERQVVVPQESRVTLELFRKVNDGERSKMGEKFTFKTAVGSGLGVLLRWHGYGAEHPTHAQRWVLDLIDPQNGVIFHRIEDGFTEPATMRPLEGSTPGEGTPAALEQVGSSAFVRLLRAEQISEPGEPVRAWWEIQAFVTLGAENVEGDPPRFQLPSIPVEKNSNAGKLFFGPNQPGLPAGDPEH